MDIPGEPMGVEQLLKTDDMGPSLCSDPTHPQGLLHILLFVLSAGHLYASDLNHHCTFHAEDETNYLKYPSLVKPSP